jgi:hypothetical protein
VLAEALVPLGLALAAPGLLCLVRPLAFLRIPTRRRAAAVLAAGALLVVVGFLLPAREVRVGTPRTRLDEVMPRYQFAEHHATHVRALPDRVFSAIRAVTADEILLFQTLTRIRRFGRPGPESVLNAPERMPLLEVATSTSFLVLAEEPDHELVIGTLVLAPSGLRSPSSPTAEDFRRLEGPGFAKAAMNFLVERDTEGSRVSTETRVFATDEATCRRFARYWRLIRPGSGLIRRTWLRAIRRRAEAPAVEPRDSTRP